MKFIFGKLCIIQLIFNKILLINLITPWFVGAGEDDIASNSQLTSPAFKRYSVFGSIFFIMSTM